MSRKEQRIKLHSTAEICKRGVFVGDWVVARVANLESALPRTCRCHSTTIPLHYTDYTTCIPLV